MRHRLALATLIVFAGACGPRTPPALRPELADRYPVHVVEPGDTLYAIAERYGVPVRRLAELNEIDDPTTLEIGQRLLIPTAASSPVAVGRSGSGSESRIPAASPVDDGTGCPMPVVVDLPSSKAGFAWPVDGVILARFGAVDGEPHPGLDLGAPMGSPVRASRAGDVTFVGQQAGFGRAIILRHGPGSFTLYARNAINCVKTGDVVRQGQALARVGDGEGTGVPYLYFELRIDGRPVDPQKRLPP